MSYSSERIAYRQGLGDLAEERNVFLKNSEATREMGCAGMANHARDTRAAKAMRWLSP
jgi:hypothetical protein